MTLEVWELLEHALRQQYSTGQSQNRAPSVENSGRVIMKNPHFCLSVFVGKYMTTTYTKACEVDFETLGSIKSCLEPPATNRPGSQLSVLGENKRVCHTHTHTHTHTHIHTLTHSLTHCMSTRQMIPTDRSSQSFFTESACGWWRHIYIYIHIHIHACIHTYIHTYTHAYIHTYIHTYTQMFMPWHSCIHVTIFRSRMQVLSAKNIKLHSPNLP